MTGRDGRIGANGGRMQWGSYGFLAGVLCGLLMGWLFHGVVGTIVRFGMIMLVVVPLVLLYLAWRRYVQPWLRPPAERAFIEPADAIETRAVVQTRVREPIAR